MPASALLLLTVAVLNAQTPTVGGNACSTQDDPHSPAAAQIRKARSAFDENRIDETIKHLKKGIQLAPGHIDAYNDLGVIYFNTGNSEAAIDAFSRMIQLSPDCLRGHLNLASTYLALERHGQAERAARKAVTLAGSDARARYLLGAALVSQNRFSEEAEQHLIEAADQVLEARYALYRLMVGRGDFEGGMRQLQLYTAGRGTNRVGRSSR